RRPAGTAPACAGWSASSARPGTPPGRASRTAAGRRPPAGPTRCRGKGGTAGRQRPTSSGRRRPRPPWSPRAARRGHASARPRHPRAYPYGLMPADQGHDEGFFGERVASVYDEHAAAMFDPAVVTPVVDLLAGLAGRGAALELGIGTGRIALPLAERGVRVAGIDSSDAMVARLRATPAAQAIEVAIGDSATPRVGGECSLVYLVFNTINNLVTQDAQVACFQNA